MKRININGINYVKEDNINFERDFQVGSGRAFKNEMGYSIYFNENGYIEISKDGQIVTQFNEPLEYDN